MFSKATAKFVRQIDPDGSLIYVSRLNDSQKLTPLALVVKHNQSWFWKKPKYRATHFNLNDLLLGDEELPSGVCRSDFLTYKGKFGSEVKVGAEVKVGDKDKVAIITKTPAVNLEMEGGGTSELQSSFGELKKEEVDVKNLLCSSRNRSLDLEHSLVQQVKKQAGVLAIVKERILTSNSCSVTQTKKERGMLKGLVTAFGSSIKGSSNINADSSVSLEIPADTVFAYSILELEIKNSGHFDICLEPGTSGGFEVELSGSARPFFDDDICLEPGTSGGFEVELSGSARPFFDDDYCLHAVSSGGSEESQKMDLSTLTQLPTSTQRDLFQKLQEAMKDRDALSYLQFVLDEMCNDEWPEPEELSESQSESADVGSDQLSPTDYGNAEQLKAVHLLVSVTEELPDETLNLLSESSADFLVAVDSLLSESDMGGRRRFFQCLPVLLQDDQAFQQVEQLLRTVSMALERDNDDVLIEESDARCSKLFGLSVRGLSLLCQQ